MAVSVFGGCVLAQIVSEWKIEQIAKLLKRLSLSVHLRLTGGTDEEIGRNYRRKNRLKEKYLNSSVSANMIKLFVEFFFQPFHLAKYLDDDSNWKVLRIVSTIFIQFSTHR